MADYNAPVQDMRFTLDHVVGMEDLTALPGFEEATADVVQAEAELDAKESAFKQQQAKLQKIAEQIEKTMVYAPTEGLVVYATSSQRGGGFRGPQIEPLDEGQSVRERQELIHLPTVDSFKAEVGVHEANLSKIAIGQPVILTMQDVVDSLSCFEDGLRSVVSDWTFIVHRIGCYDFANFLDT